MIFNKKTNFWLNNFNKLRKKMLEELLNNQDPTTSILIIGKIFKLR
jgi:hypothetical protein